jgi:uncharacterized peroxidase-related enzyme
MSTFNVPKREEVSAKNQAIFDNLEKQVGFVPNLYASYAYSENGLKNYMDFSSGASSLKAKEKEVINLAVSQVNNCEYCLAAHTAIGKMNGFNEEQIIELRQGKATFDIKLDALAKLAKNTTENRGKTDADVLEHFFNAGWTKENLIDTMLIVGDKTISNYINNTVKTPIDFPEVKAI